MVRIIPVHNFISQHVESIEEPTASCTATIMDQDMLLLAHSSHCVKVYGLAKNHTKLLTIFPTVDLVYQLLHSDKGNYVVTLESKISRDGLTINNFVRIYVNWEMTGNQNQPMRARIAGRVTPSLNRSQNSLEMIELPLNGQATKIACCQTTGNLLIAMGQDAVIHELKVETQQTSKHKFLDFEVRPWSMSFSFAPTYMELAEDFISIMNSTCFMLFRLTNRFHEDIGMLSRIDHVEKINNTHNRRSSSQSLKIGVNRDDSIERDTKIKDKTNQQSKKTSIDFTKSVSNEYMYIDWDELEINEEKELQRIQSLNLIDSKLTSITINLPTIQDEHSQTCQTLNPSIVNAPEISATITTRSNEDGWSENYSVEHLLRLTISTTSTDDTKYFTCAVLQPLYKRQKSTSNNLKCSLLRSNKYNIFNGVSCLICTNQNGYVYQFSSTSKKEMSTNRSCCRTYPFTAPVSHVALENTALHALTEAGLESYTLHIPQDKLIDNNKDELNAQEPVSLIGLRPFLGVKKLLHASRCLVLLAIEDDTWRFYSLCLPNPENVYHDILNAANNHKESSPSTYKHLLKEAYTVLQLAKDVIYYTSDATFANSINDVTQSHLENLYKQSCALLADHYITSESDMDWNLSGQYYKLAGIKAHDVLIRKDISKSPGLVTFLSENILSLEAGPEADTLFQEHNIVEILASGEQFDFLLLILASPVLREYATEKLINLLSTWEANNTTLLALVLLYTQAGRQQAAEKALEPITDEFITDKTLDNWSWLFEVTNVTKGNAMPTFSDFAGILMRQKLNVIACILAIIVERKALSLDQMIQIFLAYLPSRVGRDGRIAGTTLQQFLETYLYNFYKNPITRGNDFAIDEGFKILVRSYLAELAQKNCPSIELIYGNDDDDDYDDNILFGKLRPLFLDHPLLYAKNKYERIKKIQNDDKEESKKYIVRSEVRKLQALLISSYLPSECFHEVKHFLDTQNIEGSLSFRILCTKNTEQGIQLLADECPQLLLEFAKVRRNILNYI